MPANLIDSSIPTICLQISEKRPSNNAHRVFLTQHFIKQLQVELHARQGIMCITYIMRINLVVVIVITKELLSVRRKLPLLFQKRP